MDLRIKKTRRSIIDAFLELRTKKSLEKITVKELCERAEINKSTFYCHYTDIYDLQNQLETEVITAIINGISTPEDLFQEPRKLVSLWHEAFHAKESLIKTLFSDSREMRFVEKLEKAIKDCVFEKYPKLLRDNPKLNVAFTYTIYGGFFAFLRNSQYDSELILEEIIKLAPEKL